MQADTALWTERPSGVAQVLSRLLATQWWLVAAGIIVLASGCSARLGYVADPLMPQNDSGWTSAVLLLSIPLLGAIHVTCVRSAADVPAGSSHLWSAMRVMWWPFARLALVALLLVVPLAAALAALGHATWGSTSLALVALPAAAGFLTFAPAALVTDPDRSAAAAIATSAVWAVRRDARLVVLASVVVTAGEVAVVEAGPQLGWGQLPLRAVLAAAAMVIAAATASYTVAHVHVENLRRWLIMSPPAAGRDHRPLVGSIAVAAAASYVVLAAQPLVLAGNSGSGGSDAYQTSYASVRNDDSVPLTLTASADSMPVATLREVGFTKTRNWQFVTQPLQDMPLASSITLQPGQQAYVVAEWAPLHCSGSEVQLHTWVITHIGWLTERHVLPTTTSVATNCR